MPQSRRQTVNSRVSVSLKKSINRCKVNGGYSRQFINSVSSMFFLKATHKERISMFNSHPIVETENDKNKNSEQDQVL